MERVDSLGLFELTIGLLLGAAAVLIIMLTVALIRREIAADSAFREKIRADIVEFDEWCDQLRRRPRE